MSRRAKYLLLTPVLLLLGIVGAYVFMTWHPAEPLRFRVVEAPLSRLWGEYHEHTQITVAVENVTSTPIYLRYMCLPNPDWARGMRKVCGAIVSREQHQHLAGAQQNYLRIPAHSTIHAAALVMNERVADARAGRLRADYQWMSHSKFCCGSALQWLRNRLPRVVPRVFTEFPHGMDEGSLDPVKP